MEGGAGKDLDISGDMKQPEENAEETREDAGGRIKRQRRRTDSHEDMENHTDP